MGSNETNPHITQNQMCMFLWYFADNPSYPKISVEKPTTIGETTVTFEFRYGQEQQRVVIPKQNILAVIDRTFGSTHFLNWNGIYRIINQSLVDECIENRILSLNDNYGKRAFDKLPE